MCLQLQFAFVYAVYLLLRASNPHAFTLKRCIVSPNQIGLELGISARACLSLHEQVISDTVHEKKTNPVSVRFHVFFSCLFVR